MVSIDNIKIADIGFYINLDYRTDRNKNILKNLEEYNIKGVERYSGNTSTTSGPLNLVKTTFEIYRKFLETDAETLLILEDDCLFLPPLKENTQQIFDDIYSNNWDLFWVGNVNRRAPIYYNNNCYRVSSTSYAQSYIIKRKMAEDVLKYFDPDWNSLGIDEMLCLFTYGFDIAKDPNKFNFYEKDQPLDHFTPEYISLCYKISFTTQYNSYSDNWNCITNLENWIPRHSPIPYYHEPKPSSKIIKLLAITWNYEDSYDLTNTFLYKSFIKNNNPDDLIQIHFNRNNYIDLEKEFDTRFGYQYEFLLYRIYLIRDKVKNLINSEYIIVADTSDVVCLDNINTINPPDYILFSSEANPYPHSKGDWGVPDYSEDERNNRHYLNGGLFISPKGQYLDFLNSIVENIFPKNLKSFGGDQGVFSYHYLNKNNPTIVLDKEFKLFLCIYERNANDFINYKFPIFIHDNGWNYGSPRFIEKFNLI